MIKVVIVDDSALIRQLLTKILSSDPGITVVGAAPDPLVARQMIKDTNPDVVTLDIEMPKMDGLSFLEKIMRLRPMPVVMISSLTQKGADATLRSLELGAVDFIGKPKMDVQEGLSESTREIVAKVKAAATAKVRALKPVTSTESKPARKLGFASTEWIIAIGASTGGVTALRDVICDLPPDCPATLVTQHMPAKFTATFAPRLDGVAAVTVTEARDGERALPGHVYLAPGDQHLELHRSGANYVCRLQDAPPVSGHRPSVDVLFRSVAEAAGERAVGAILTGMGRDGAEGLLEMRRYGAHTIGQDEATCVVYGMPRAAEEIGAVERQLPLSKIADAILAGCGDAKVRAVRV